MHKIDHHTTREKCSVSTIHSARESIGRGGARAGTTCMHTRNTAGAETSDGRVGARAHKLHELHELRGGQCRRSAPLCCHDLAHERGEAFLVARAANEGVHKELVCRRPRLGLGIQAPLQEVVEGRGPLVLLFQHGRRLRRARARGGGKSAWVTVIVSVRVQPRRAPGWCSC